nr:hypothetical protein [Fodinibius sp.]NIV12016.1 hypothetical protein [Fodinibius sp.]NIY25662.1 hypothetical protein [Fodinibius sp.]
TSLNIRALAFNDSGHIFAGTWIEGVFRSKNNGDDWLQVNNGLPLPALVRALAINENEEIFAGLSEGVYRSTDNGDNWTSVSNGLPQFNNTFSRH